MKILFLAPHPFYQDRGTPIDVRLAVEGLVRLGHEVDLLTYHTGRDVPLGGARHVRIPRVPGVRHVPIGPSIRKAVCDVPFFFSALRMASVGDYDLIHAGEEAAFMALFIHRQSGIPFVYDMDSCMSEQLRGRGMPFRPWAGLFERLEAATVRASAGVLPVCPALVEYAESLDPDAEVALLHDVPVGGDQWSPLRTELDRIEGVKFLYVGNLEPYQGIDLLIDAFAHVARLRDDATLLVVGGDDRSIEAYRRAVARRGLASRIRFLGRSGVQALTTVLQGADVLVSPRIQGINTPMKIYSYLRSGRAVLATRLRTHTQVLDDGVAKLVEPEPSTMATGMVELVDSPSERERLGRAGREYVEREFSETRFQERLEAFYRSLAGRLELSGDGG